MNVQQFYDKQITLIHGDCLDVMQQLKPNIVDFVFADLPYGKTDNAWDTHIDLTELWHRLVYISKPTTPYIFTASNGFEYDLHASNPKMYKYKWIWNKNNSAGFANAKKQPLRTTEDVLVFYRDTSTYNPQMTVRGKERKKGGYTKTGNYNIDPSLVDIHNNVYYPKALLDIPNASQVGKYHATQKPTELMEYLILTYTNPGDLILDPVMGVGSTAMACIRTNRRFIGIELYPLPDKPPTDSRGDNPNNFAIACQRVTGELD